MRRAIILAALLAAGSALADEATKPPVFTFTEAQVRVIAEAAIAKRDAAAAEWTRWNDILADIQKQATPSKTEEPPKAP